MPLPPLFLLGFVAFALFNVSGLIPSSVQVTAAQLCRFCLVMAMAAIGFTLPWRSVKSYGWRPVSLLLILSDILLLLMVAFVSEHAFLVLDDTHPVQKLFLKLIDRRFGCAIVCGAFWFDTHIHRFRNATSPIFKDILLLGLRLMDIWQT